MFILVHEFPNTFGPAKLLHEQHHPRPCSHLQVSDRITQWSNMICFPRDTLTRLEIDHSLRTTDAIVPDMIKLHNLKLLSMAGTTLSTQALAVILLGLKKLVSLPNGDFLCDVLEWLVYESPEETWPRGKISLSDSANCSSLRD